MPVKKRHTYKKDIFLSNKPKRIFLGTEPHYIAQAGLERLLLLLRPPKYKDYRHVSPRPQSSLMQTPSEVPYLKKKY
jgi:hypothetical protein